MDYSYNFISLEASNVLRDWLLEFSFIYEITKNGTVMKKWSVYVEPIIEDNANIQVDMTGQESSCYCCVII